MPAVDADHGLECPYDVHELPSFEEYDTDFASYRQAFIAEMNRWVRQGYEVIGVASHSGRLLGFFKRTAGKPVKSSLCEALSPPMSAQTGQAVSSRARTG